MNAALPALGSTVVAEVPGRTWSRTGVLTEEVPAAGMTNVIDARNPTDEGRLAALGELFTFPASRRAPLGAAGSFHITNLCAEDFTRVRRTSHRSRMFAVGKQGGDGNRAICPVQACG